MSVVEVAPVMQAAVRARYRREVAELDYQRRLREVVGAGFTQRQIAARLGISQPSVQSALRTAARVSMPVEGFSGATPGEICRRYAAGLLDRERLVEELTGFPYATPGHTDGYDGLLVDPPGAWSEVEDAARHGLIEDDVYADVFARRHPDIAGDPE